MKTHWSQFFPCAVFAVGLVVAQEPPSPPAQTPEGQQEQEAQFFTNANVVKLCKSFTDETVIKRIRQAANVKFDTDDDSLLKLKEDGVSEAVIQGMIDRAGSSQEAKVAASGSIGIAAAGTPGTVETPKLVQGPMGIEMARETDTVRLVGTDKGEQELTAIGGSISTTYAFVTALIHMDYPNVRADVRTKDRRPSILLASGKSPTGRYFVVRAKVDKGDETRSVKLGNMGMFGAKGMNIPDKDNQVSCVVTEETPGLWRLTPKENLKPGEYGLWIPSQEIYDFGVD